MQTILKSEIPEYLKDGELYRTLIDNNDDPDEEVAFPSNALKPDMSVHSVEDCDHLLNSLSFWGVETFAIPELVSYVLSECVDAGVAILETYRLNYSWVGWLLDVVMTDCNLRWSVAITSQIPELVESLLAAGIVFPPEAVEQAAEIGSADILELLHRNGLKVELSTVSVAVETGHVDVLTFILKSGLVHPSEEYDYCGAMTALAATGGHLNCLKVLRDYGWDWGIQTCELAALNGHLDCLKYAHEQGCPWNEATCTNAVRYDQLECLQYAHQNGCPWDFQTCCELVVYKGSLRCLQYAHEQGLPLDEGTSFIAAMNTSSSCLQYLHEQGCPWDETTCNVAAQFGNLNCLMYAHEQGCPWGENTCYNAAENGHLDCLVYAHEQGCPWSEYTCMAAVTGDSLECLEYAHQHGCSLDNITLNMVNPDTACYDYLQKHVGKRRRSEINM